MKGVAVAGATGRVGRHVVDVLQERGHEAVPMSRSTGVDVVTGDGLAAALTGVECLIDVATGPSPDQEEATEFFTAAARNLQRGRRAGRGQRIVVVSIIGVDRLPRLRCGEGRPGAGRWRARSRFASCARPSSTSSSAALEWGRQVTRSTCRDAQTAGRRQNVAERSLIWRLPTVAVHRGDRWTAGGEPGRSGGDAGSPGR